MHEQKHREKRLLSQENEFLLKDILEAILGVPLQADHVYTKHYLLQALTTLQKNTAKEEETLEMFPPSIDDVLNSYGKLTRLLAHTEYYYIPLDVNLDVRPDSNAS